MKLGPRQLALVKALESGKYAQTKQQLRDETGFCCLGVACDVSKTPIQRMHSDGSYGYGIQGELASGVLPPSTMRHFGFFGSGGEPNVFGDKRSRLSLYRLNDNGATFKQIASILRRFPELYFRKSK